MSTTLIPPRDVVSASEWEVLSKEEGYPFSITFVSAGQVAVMPYHDLKNVIGADNCIRLEFHSRKIVIDGVGDLRELAELIGDHKVRRVKQTGRILKIAVLEYRKDGEDDE